jgi:hypothetical protein
MTGLQLRAPFKQAPAAKRQHMHEIQAIELTINTTGNYDQSISSILNQKKKRAAKGGGEENSPLQQPLEFPSATCRPHETVPRTMKKKDDITANEAK